jgi:hypothetical protein
MWDGGEKVRPKGCARRFTLNAKSLGVSGLRQEKLESDFMRLCNIRAPVELQSAPCASKRFGAIPPEHSFANAFRLKCSVNGSSPMNSPKVSRGVPLNKLVFIQSTSVVHSA